MRVLRINSVNGKKIATKNTVKYLNYLQYSFGVPIRLYIGSITTLEAKEDEEYIIDTDTRGAMKLSLVRNFKSLIGKEKLHIYEFVTKEIKEILNNKRISNYEGVSFKKYIKKKDNMLDYFIFELRKQQSLLTVRENRVKASQSQILLMSPPKKIGNYDIQKLENFKKFAKNYYTVLEGGTTKRTENGENTAILLPFATPQDIIALNNYITPKYSLSGATTSLNIGDTVMIDNEKTVVIELEEFNYNGQNQAFVITGVKV